MLADEAAGIDWSIHRLSEQKEIDPLKNAEGHSCLKALVNRYAAQLLERNVAQINGKRSVDRDRVGKKRDTDARMK